VLLLSLVLLVTSAWGALSRGFTFMPEIDMNNLSLEITMPEGTTRRQAVELADTVLERVMTVDNVQDASQLQMPITLPIILALLMMFVVIKDPNSQLAFWFSIIPFTSPIVMMARIPYDIPLWEVALSLVVLYASFVGMVWFAAKIYRVGIFMYGKKPSLKELFKWIRYKY